MKKKLVLILIAVFIFTGAVHASSPRFDDMMNVVPRHDDLVDRYEFEDYGYFYDLVNSKRDARFQVWAYSDEKYYHMLHHESGVGSPFNIAETAHKHDVGSIRGKPSPTGEFVVYEFDGPGLAIEGYLRNIYRNDEKYNSFEFRIVNGAHVTENPEEYIAYRDMLYDKYNNHHQMRMYYTVNPIWYDDYTLIYNIIDRDIFLNEAETAAASVKGVYKTDIKTGETEKIIDGRFAVSDYISPEVNDIAGDVSILYLFKQDKDDRNKSEIYYYDFNEEELVNTEIPGVFPKVAPGTGDLAFTYQDFKYAMYMESSTPYKPDYDDETTVIFDMSDHDSLPRPVQVTDISPTNNHIALHYVRFYEGGNHYYNTAFMNIPTSLKPPGDNRGSNRFDIDKDINVYWSTRDFQYSQQIGVDLSTISIDL